MPSASHLTRDLRSLAPITDDALAEFVGGGQSELRDAILEMAQENPLPAVADRTTEARTRRPRMRVTAVVALAVTTVAGAGAVAWAVTSSDVTHTTAVECVVHGEDAVVPSTSGDPVVDCGAVWRQLTGSAPPALVAYANGLGGITVQPVSAPVPKGFSALPSGTVQNGSLIELQESLDDYVAGLNAACYSNTAAVALTERELTRLGFEGWTVTAASADANGSTSAPPERPLKGLGSQGKAVTAPGTIPDGSASCVENSLVDPQRHNVTLLPMVSPPSAGFVPVQLAQHLRTVAATCQALPEATASVEQAAASLGLSQANSTYELSQVTEDVPCTRIYESVGGTIFLVLRGPSG